MEFFTLDDMFLRASVVDQYESAIWTERFVGFGDFQIVLPSTPERILSLGEGKLIGLQGSKETMLIETQSIEDGVMTVKGFTIEKFLNERYFKTSVADGVNELKFRNRPGLVIGQIVQGSVVAGGAYVNLGGQGGDLNVIPNLTVGELDESNDVVSITVPFGPIYDAIKPIADTYKIGLSLYLNTVDAFTYSLVFKAYKGVNRTSDQVMYDPIKFSAAQDSLANIKELRSVAGYKTVVYVYPPDWSSSTTATVAYAPGADPAATGFGRRVLHISASDISQDQITGGVTLAALMTQKATDALANNNFTKMIDGEVVPQPGYIYDEHFNLGDVIELVGQSEIAQKAYITEFIRSKDGTGERAYPTVSVIE